VRASMQLREGTGREVFFVSLENYFKSKFLGSFPEVGITVVIEISFINCGCLLGVCPPRITVSQCVRNYDDFFTCLILPIIC